MLEIPGALFPATCHECEKAQVALRSETLQAYAMTYPSAMDQEMIPTQFITLLFLTKSIVGFNE